jgi:hypothetical protein
MSNLFGEGIDFYTCGEYALCKQCNYINKPCHENPLQMYNEYIKKLIENKQKEVNELLNNS